MFGAPPKRDLVSMLTKANVLAAVEHEAHVVVGTSGLSEQDYA